MSFSEKLKLSASAKNSVKKAFLSGLDVAWTEKSEQYCDYRLDGKYNGGWIRAKQYTNGTLYMEASDAEGLSKLMQLGGFASASASPTKESGRSKKPVAKASGEIDIAGTYIGTDESGKGDYFGPLVAAGVLVTDQTAGILKTLGVQDSKALTDKNIDGIFQDIVAVVGMDSIAIVELKPEKYNELYGKFKLQKKNLNHLLGWLHATVIEKILEKNTDCKQAIADKFGNEFYITSQLKELGKGVELYQTPRAEANVGVAAASIVARHHFVKRMDEMNQKYGMELSKGASAKVKSQAKRFVAQYGKDRLGEIAKLHFKTTQEL